MKKNKPPVVANYSFSVFLQNWDEWMTQEKE